MSCCVLSHLLLYYCQCLSRVSIPPQSYNNVVQCSLLAPTLLQKHQHYQM
jgi:hypothetical protein